VKALACGGSARSASHPPSPIHACSFTRHRTALLGVAPRCSGESRRRHPGECLPESPASARHSMAFTPQSHQTGGGAALGRVGFPGFVRQTTSMRAPAIFAVRPITCQSTRTHNSRRRLRRKVLWSGHLHVIWHWRRMHRVSSALSTYRKAARIGRTRSAVTLLGVAPSRSGESRACMAESKLGRRHGVELVGWLSLPFALAGQALRVRSHAGESLACGFATSRAMPPFSSLHRGNARSAAYNWSFHTDACGAGEFQR